MREREKDENVYVSESGTGDERKAATAEVGVPPPPRSLMRCFLCAGPSGIKSAAALSTSAKNRSEKKWKV